MLHYIVLYCIVLYCIVWVRPNSCNSQKKDLFIFWANVVLSVFLRAQNRAFRCFPSCKKSCSRSRFLVLSFVHKIVLFGALPRAKNCAFWCSPSCQKPCSRSCFLVLSFVPKIVLFGALLRALRSFVQTWCSRSVLSFVHKILLFFFSCHKPCFLVLSLVAKNRALDRAFWCSPSCRNRALDRACCYSF